MKTRCTSITIKAGDNSKINYNAQARTIEITGAATISWCPTWHWVARRLGSAALTCWTYFCVGWVIYLAYIGLRIRL